MKPAKNSKAEFRRFQFDVNAATMKRDKAIAKAEQQYRSDMQVATDEYLRRIS